MVRDILIIMGKKRKKAGFLKAIRGNQDRGAAKIVGVIIAVILLLIAGVFGYLAVTQKNEPQLVVDTAQVSADDLLTSGKTDNDLETDYKIIAAGTKRDGEERDTTKTALDDEALPVGTGVTADTTVQTARLSQLQTEFNKEVDRRLAKLKEVSAKTDKLTDAQKTLSDKYILDETTALTGLKTKATAETSVDELLKDRDALDKEYDSYRMVVVQVYMLLWANDQRILAEKANVLGGKLQERMNDASNHGVSIAHMQTLLNGYQTNKEQAKSLNESTLVLVEAVQPATFNGTKPVLQSYFDNFSKAHDALQKTSDMSKDVIIELEKSK
jgi:hypothetical protein